MVDDTTTERTPATAGRFRPDDDPPGRTFGRALRRWWHDERPGVAIPRDLLFVAVVLGLLLSGLWLYTGQPFLQTSPIVVVESGSMMHPDPPYGRVGTIDPGDLVLVKVADGAGDVATAYGDGADDRTGYGGAGDVIVYRPRGDLAATPIIHRAMTWVEVTPAGNDANGEPVYLYTYRDESGTLRSAEHSVTIESIGINEMRPTASGFVTRGDNPFTNRLADQVTHVPGRLVEPDWIIGKARGEIPWLGLIKLAVTGNPVPSQAHEQCQFGAAWAPCDTWAMLLGSFVALLGVPLVLDQVARRNTAFRGWLDR